MPACYCSLLNQSLPQRQVKSRFSEVVFDGLSSEGRKKPLKLTLVFPTVIASVPSLYSPSLT